MSVAFSCKGLDIVVLLSLHACLYLTKKSFETRIVIRSFVAAMLPPKKRGGQSPGRQLAVGGFTLADSFYLGVELTGLPQSIIQQPSPRKWEPSACFRVDSPRVPRIRLYYVLLLVKAHCAFSIAGVYFIYDLWREVLE